MIKEKMPEVDQKARPVMTMIILSLLNLVIALCWTSLAALMPTISVEFSMSHTMGMFVWGIVTLGVALGALFGGGAADRFGARKVIGVVFLIGALSMVGRAIAPNAWFLAGAMFIFGMVLGFATPSIPKVIACHVEPEHLGRANGIILCTLTLGIALTNVTAHSVLAPLAGGWRPLMGYSGGIMALMGVVWLVFIRDRGTLVAKAGIGKVIGMVRDRQVLRLTAIQTMQLGGYTIMIGLLPRALTESGLAPERVGITMAFWLVAVGLAKLFAPWLSDTYGRRRPFVIYGALLAGTALAFMTQVPTWAVIWLLIIVAMGSGTLAPLLFTIPVELKNIGPVNAGSAIGFMMTVGQVGAFLLSLVTGAAADAGGLRGALVVLALMHFVILMPAYGLVETGWRKKK